jgi:hypothetical protein
MSKIKVFLRHWNGAVNRKKEVRPEWFSYDKCLHSVRRANVDLTVLLDGTKEDHHLAFSNNDRVVEYTGGSDAASLLFCLDYIQKQNLDDDDIVYIVEDDYLHNLGWEDVLTEAFESFDVDYVTLYDHNDKYILPAYDTLQSKILYTKSVHWRTAPSTCNTYAAKWKTLQRHWNTHIKYCLPEHTHGGYDHTKFLDLWSQGSNLISPIPGYSTHCEMPFVSPIVDWSKL